MEIEILISNFLYHDSFYGCTLQLFDEYVGETLLNKTVTGKDIEVIMRGKLHVQLSCSRSGRKCRGPGVGNDNDRVKMHSVLVPLLEHTQAGGGMKRRLG